MKILTDIEVQKAAALKAARAAIRLKHSLAADREIAAKLPGIEMQFEDALSSGEPFALDIASVIDEA